MKSNLRDDGAGFGFGGGGGGCGLGFGLEMAVALLCLFRPRPDVSIILALWAADSVEVCIGAGGGGSGAGLGVGGNLILSLSEPGFFRDAASLTSSASAIRSSLKVSSVWMMAALSFAAIALADGLLFRALLCICKSLRGRI